MKSADLQTPEKPKLSASTAALNTSDDPSITFMFQIQEENQLDPTEQQDNIKNQIITNYQPFSSHEKIIISKILDSPIKIINSEKKIVNNRLIKSYRKPSKSYSKSQERVLSNCCQDSKVYIGEYNGKFRDGFGKLYDTNRTLVYEGEWKNDQAHGKGIWYNNEIKSNFSKYIGDFENGQKSGAGIEFYRDGSIYVGSFKKDCKDGMGQLTKKSGQKLNGRWFMGKLIDQI